MLNLLFTNPVYFLAGAVTLVIAIAIHEFAHAWSADRLGDPTPRVQGRLTLNPLSHLDPIGTLALVFVGFGWGRPVQFDPYNLKDPRRDAAIISFAGPLSNLAMAIIASLLLRLIIELNIFPQIDLYLFEIFIKLNIVLMIFNLVPIHPLDGGKILIGLLPQDMAHEWDKILHQYGIYLLLILVLPLFNGVALASRLIGPTIEAVYSLIIYGIHTY